MATKNNKSNHSNSAPSTTTATAKRTKARKPPVAERMTVSASPVAPPTPASAPPTPATPPPATPPPATPPPATPPPAGVATPVAAPPPATIPAVPSGFVAVNAADLMGFRVMASQVAALPDAIAELQGFTSYTAVFGITAPDVGQLTQLLTVASQWTLLLSQTAAWYKYAKSQQGMAWKDALEQLDALKPAFDLASTANAALLSQYPALARLLGARGVVAKRAAASRAKDKAAALKTASAQSTPAAAPAATPAPAVAPAAAPSAPAGGANGAAATTPAPHA